MSSAKGSFPATAGKPRDMAGACRALENEPPDANRVGDRSLRLLIPRALPVLYEIRNNRGVGHLGGDVDANHMDAEAVQAVASWIMAELVRIFHGVATQEAQDTADALVERKSPAIRRRAETSPHFTARRPGGGGNSAQDPSGIMGTRRPGARLRAQLVRKVREIEVRMLVSG